MRPAGMAGDHDSYDVRKLALCASDAYYLSLVPVYPRGLWWRIPRWLLAYFVIDGFGLLALIGAVFQMVLAAFIEPGSTGIDLKAVTRTPLWTFAANHTGWV